VQIGVVLATAHLLGLAFQRIGQPRVMGEMIAGILLGPSLLGRVAPAAFAHLFPADGLGALNALSQIGLILFLFLVGLEVRPHQSSGVAGPAIAASSASILVPLALGGMLAVSLHRELASLVPLPAFALFMGAAMSITAFPVLARILTERGMLSSRAGAIAISCAAVDDVAAWCLVALLMAAAATAWLLVLAGLAVYGVVMLYAVRPMLRRHPPNLPASLLLLLASSWATEALGVHALFGAFVAGLAMPRDTQLPKLIEPLTSTLLLPLFFAFTGLRTNIALVSGTRLWLYWALIIAVAISGKLFGCAFALRARGLSWRESLTVGTLVNTRGLIELVILNIGLDRKIISPALFSMMVLMTLTTTFMTAPLLSIVNPVARASVVPR
jgi:Kef-type K+ transport system membrane component KefB